MLFNKNAAPRGLGLRLRAERVHAVGAEHLEVTRADRRARQHVVEEDAARVARGDLLCSHTHTRCRSVVAVFSQVHDNEDAQHA
jgi:hypothetical protein